MGACPHHRAHVEVRGQLSSQLSASIVWFLKRRLSSSCFVEGQLTSSGFYLFLILLHFYFSRYLESIQYTNKA